MLDNGPLYNYLRQRKTSQCSHKCTKYKLNQEGRERFVREIRELGNIRSPTQFSSTQGNFTNNFNKPFLASENLQLPCSVLLKFTSSIETSVYLVSLNRCPRGREFLMGCYDQPVDVSSLILLGTTGIFYMKAC